MKKNKILITGGLGFIFSYVTELYIKKGWDVVVIDNLSDGSHPELLTKDFVFYSKAVEDSLDLIIREAPDYIIHAAAISDVDSSVKSPIDVISRNVLGSVIVFEAARQIPNLKKLVYISTDEVYGECEHRKTEEEILFPKNPYACSKAFGSLLRLTYENTYPELKDKTAETRFCNVFGPRQDKRKILGAIKDALENGASIPIHQEGKGYREYIYVKNIPDVIDLIIERGDRVYNVTLNEGFTVKQLLEKVNVKTHKGDRPGMDLKYQMDNKRIMDLGWKPRYTFEEGLKEYLHGETI